MCLYLEDIDESEIAEIVGISPGGSKNHSPVFPIYDPTNVQLLGSTPFGDLVFSMCGIEQTPVSRRL